METAALTSRTLSPKTRPLRVPAKPSEVPQRDPSLGRGAARNPLPSRSPLLGKLSEPNNPENLPRALASQSPRAAGLPKVNQGRFPMAQKNRLPKTNPR